MRNPKRINEILEIISDIWKSDPDMRFNQLIYILQSEYSNKNNGQGKVESAKIDGFTQVGFDLFSAEDDSFLEFLKEKSNQGGFGNGT